MIGSNVSHYKVTSKLGEGGMGEVWRAEDTKLGRDVALKMLPDGFAQDPERLARFEREARVLASLSHPNIAGIHGLEEVEGKRFLVMELVDGQTLAERIQQGPMPVEEAVRIAKQIAEAVEAAHEKGVVHRDLKPANVNITRDGNVKVLDFGLAKALIGDPMSGDSPNHDLSLSPTLTQAMTGMGVLLGTAGYMSPEQARGKPVDRRADIWAFGCILYEMLTGQRLFTGETATDVIGAVVHKEPDLDELSSKVPAPIRRLLERCLQKDANRRLQSIGDARIALQEWLENPEAEEVVAELVGVVKLVLAENRELAEIEPDASAVEQIAAVVADVFDVLSRPQSGVPHEVADLAVHSEDLAQRDAAGEGRGPAVRLDLGARNLLELAHVVGAEVDVSGLDPDDLGKLIPQEQFVGAGVVVEQVGVDILDVDRRPAEGAAHVHALGPGIGGEPQHQSHRECHTQQFRT